MVALCSSGDYDLVYQTLNTVDHPAHASSCQHPLHLAVRSSHVDSVRGILDTQKFDINERVKTNIPNYSLDKINALDVAIYHKYISILDCIIENGGRPPPRPTLGLDHGVYKRLRQADIKMRGSAGTGYPPYAKYKAATGRDIELAAGM